MTAPNPAAGKPVDPASLVNVPQLVTAYFASKPDPSDPTQRVAFGTSGHRGTSLKNSFNENHILATTQAICDHRRETGLTGPLFVGIGPRSTVPEQSVFCAGRQETAAAPRRLLEAASACFGGVMSNFAHAIASTYNPANHPFREVM